MTDKVNINEGRELLAPVTGAYAERIRIGEATHRDRLMAWVARNMGELLDEVQGLRAIIAEFLPHPNGPSATTEGDPDAWRAAMFNLGRLRDELAEQTAEVARLRGLVEKACALALSAGEDAVGLSPAYGDRHLPRLKHRIETIRKDSTNG